MFTTSAEAAIECARFEARDCGCASIRPEHVILGVIAQRTLGSDALARTLAPDRATLGTVRRIASALGWPANPQTAGTLVTGADTKLVFPRRGAVREGRRTAGGHR
jgi:hypothetical protein